MLRRYWWLPFITSVVGLCIAALAIKVTDAILYYGPTLVRHGW